MALDFPATPTIGQIYTDGTVSYEWDGTVWGQVAGTGAAAYVRLTGDTMTGLLTLPFDPIVALDAATKQYVDSVSTGGDAPANGFVWGRKDLAWSQIAIVDVGGLTPALDAKVDLAGDAMLGPLALVADPTLPLEAATKQYVDGLTTTGLDTKVDLAGDTMTGALILWADPTGALEAATKQYVDNGLLAGLDLKVDIAGDTMTGPLILAADPVALLEAATKQYVDVPDAALELAKVDRAGDTMTGDLTLPATTPTLLLHATTKQYVDSVVAAGGLYRGLWQVTSNTPDLTPSIMNPVDGWSWMAQTADPAVPETAPAALPGIGGQTVAQGDMIQWSTVGAAYARIPGGGLTIADADLRYVNSPGDTMTGPLVLAADPVVLLEAATKQYVDVAGLALDTAKVNRGGDTMIGALQLIPAMPTATTEATHKQYVDEAIAAQSLYQGTWQPGPNLPDLTPAVANPLHSYSWIAQTVDPLGTETPPAGIPGLSGVAVGSADTVIWNEPLATYQIVRSPAAASGFVPITGGTMTGTLSFDARPPTEHAIKIANDSGAETLKLSGSSGTMHTGLMEFFAPDGTRRGYIGFSDAANHLNLTAEGTGVKWAVNGGIYMRGAASSLHWASDSAVTSVTDFSKGICLYGYGGTSQFGFNITSGTLNYVVQNAGNHHKFWAGTGNAATINASGVIAPGLFVGDTWHGWVWDSVSNGEQLRSYQGKFEFRKTNGSTPGTLQATLNNGNLNLTGSLDCASHIQTSASGMYLSCDIAKALHFRRSSASSFTARWTLCTNNNNDDEWWFKANTNAGTNDCMASFNRQDWWMWLWGNMSAQAFTDRGSAATKANIRDTVAAEVMAAWQGLKPKRFSKFTNPDQPTEPEKKLRYGFIADELEANPATKGLTNRDSGGERTFGTDIMQVLALTVARLKLLEAEVAALQAAA